MSAADNPLGQPALKSALAELLGTFFLALAALTVAAPLTPFAVGLTLLAFVYAVGSLSGAHLNPAVTVGLVVSRRFPLAHGLLYLVAQVAGALLAGLLVSHGVLNPAVALAMGLGASPAVWATLLSAAGFGLLFSVIERTAPAEVHNEGKPVPRLHTASQ